MNKKIERYKTIKQGTDILLQSKQRQSNCNGMTAIHKREINNNK